MREVFGKVSLKKIERIFKYYDIICRMVKDFGHFSTVPYLIPVAVFSKVLDRNFFIELFEKGNVEAIYDNEDMHVYLKKAVYDRFTCAEIEEDSDQQGKQEGLFDCMSRLVHGSKGRIDAVGSYNAEGDGSLDLGGSPNSHISVSSRKETLNKIYYLVDSLV